MEPAAAPAGTSVIRSYHAHLYFLSPQARTLALALREAISARFSVQLGRVHEVPVGPHDAPMHQVAFSRELFASFLSWLMLNRGALSVLVHPNTGRARDDHHVARAVAGRTAADPCRAALQRSRPRRHLADRPQHRAALAGE